MQNIEVFYVSTAEAILNPDLEQAGYGTCTLPGWYWWSCCPGCLPDSDPFGPFETEAEALTDANNID